MIAHELIARHTNIASRKAEGLPPSSRNISAKSKALFDFCVLLSTYIPNTKIISSAIAGISMFCDSQVINVSIMGNVVIGVSTY
jgi:hypothetical protein